MSETTEKNQIYISFCHYLFIFKGFIYFIFREREREGERKGEKHQCVVASHVTPTGDLACNLGMCPALESNWRPFGLQPMLNPLSYTSQGYISYYKSQYHIQKKRRTMLETHARRRGVKNGNL